MRVGQEASQVTKLKLSCHHQSPHSYMDSFSTGLHRKAKRDHEVGTNQNIWDDFTISYNSGLGMGRAGVGV